MTMPDNHETLNVNHDDGTALSTEQDNYSGLSEECKWADSRIIAREIIARLGADHCIDSDYLWEATWQTSAGDKIIELSEEKDEDDGYEYSMFWLNVLENDGHSYAYGFDELWQCISFSEEDGNEIEYDIETQLDTYRRLEYDIDQLLRTAPIELSSVPICDGWSDLFEGIWLHLAADDDKLQIFNANRQGFRSYYPLSLAEIRQLEEMTAYIKCEYSLTNKQAHDVVGYRPPSYFEEED